MVEDCLSNDLHLSSQVLEKHFWLRTFTKFSYTFQDHVTCDTFLPIGPLIGFLMLQKGTHMSIGTKDGIIWADSHFLIRPDWFYLSSKWVEDFIIIEALKA